jgi:hypothetical protein
MKLPPARSLLAWSGWVLALVLGAAFAVSSQSRDGGSSALIEDYRERLRDANARADDAEGDRASLLEEIGPLRDQIRSLEAQLEQQQELITSYKGSGNSQSRSFTAGGAWEVSWNASGDLFQLYIYTPDGELLTSHETVLCPCKGKSYVPTAGTYSFDVNANCQRPCIGSWTVRVVNA